MDACVPWLSWRCVAWCCCCLCCCRGVISVSIGQLWALVLTPGPATLPIVVGCAGYARSVGFCGVWYLFSCSLLPFLYPKPCFCFCTLPAVAGSLKLCLALCLGIELQLSCILAAAELRCVLLLLYVMACGYRLGLQAAGCVETAWVAYVEWSNCTEPPGVRCVVCTLSSRVQCVGPGHMPVTAGSEHVKESV